MNDVWILAILGVIVGFLLLMVVTQRRTNQHLFQVVTETAGAIESMQDAHDLEIRNLRRTIELLR